MIAVGSAGVAGGNDAFYRRGYIVHRVKVDITLPPSDLLPPPHHVYSLHWAASVLRVVANLLDQCATAQDGRQHEPSEEGHHESSARELP